MENTRIILASASPRRRELLEQVGLAYEAMPSRIEEVVTATDPAEVVEELSMQKALDVASRCGDGIVLGADTVVSQGGEIMGKPADEEDAVRMISRLQGSVHSVFTGVTLVKKAEGHTRIRTFSSETKVYVYPMSEEEIREYVRTGEPMDKAGAYGIQGRFGAFIEKIEGDYNTVVGLPAAAVYQELKLL